MIELVLAQVGAYAAIVAVAVAVPGPDFAVVTRNALHQGTASGFATVAGVAAGTLVHVAVAAAGLTVLLTTSVPLFTAVQLAGAAYLAYLGATGLALLVRRAGPVAAAAPDQSGGRSRRGAPLTRPFRQGLLTNLANPKVVLFYVALMPHFIGWSTGWWWPCLLVTVSVLINSAWFGALAGAMHRWGAVLRRPRAALLLDGVSALLFLGVAVWLTVEVVRVGVH